MINTSELEILIELAMRFIDIMYAFQQNVLLSSKISGALNEETKEQIRKNIRTVVNSLSEDEKRTLNFALAKPLHETDFKKFDYNTMALLFGVKEIHTPVTNTFALLRCLLSQSSNDILLHTQKRLVACAGEKPLEEYAGNKEAQEFVAITKSMDKFTTRMQSVLDMIRNPQAKDSKLIFDLNGGPCFGNCKLSEKDEVNDG